MAGAVGPHVSATGLAIDLGGDLAHDRRNNLPRLARTSGHERRTFKRAFFAAGNAHPDVMNSFSFEIFATALGVGEKRIAAVDHDVAFFEKRKQLTNDHVEDRKSTRLNSSHLVISYAVFCLK